MSEITKCVKVNMETDKSGCSKNYCFGCLRDRDDKQIQSYTFVCGPLKEIFQMQRILLCRLCKRMAQHTETFIQNVQSNQMLLDNYCNVMDKTLKPIRLQCQPLVELQQVTLDTIELCDKQGTSNDMEECCTVVNGRGHRERVGVKLEMKEEAELLDHIEAEFINGDDEFPEMYVKEEDDYPLKDMLKEELEVSNMELANLSSTNKKKVKKKEKIKQEDTKKTRRGIPKIKQIYQTRAQVMEERARLSQEPRYSASAFRCDRCVKGFSFSASYDAHMQKHDPSMGEYECDICRQRVDSEDKLVNHMRYHLIRYRCPSCGVTRNCRTTIREHYSAHHLAPDRLYACHLCNKTFTRQLNLRKHVRYSHGSAERVQCAHCQRMYANKFVLKSHMMLKHAEAGGAAAGARCVCAECGGAFRTPSQLRNHAVKHSARRDYYCVECDKSFKSESILKTHLKTAAIHVNYKELPLSCSHCEKRFSNRRDVERHTNRVHLNVKPFTCDRCDKAYVNAWALKDHKRYIHEGYKRPLQYPCPMCDKVFDRAQVLKSHVRTHTGERPYRCAACPAQFAQAGVLRTHERLVHLRLTRDGRPRAPPTLPPTVHCDPS